MTQARTALDTTKADRQPSLLRLTVVALLLALGFDALSTHLAWDVVRAVESTVQRGPVHAVRPADVRDPSRRGDGAQPSAEPPH